MTRQRVVRPAEMPRQRGSETPPECSPARAPARRSRVPPRSGRRPPTSRYSPVAESLVGFLLCVLVIGATIAVVAVVLAAWTGLA